MNDGRVPWLRPVVALFVSAVFFMPLYLVLVNVFKHGADIVPDPAGLPSPPTMDNIAAVLSRSDNLFVYGLVNSVAVTAISITILTVLSAMLGHYIARSRHLLAKVVMVTLLCGLLIPSPVILAPITMVLRTLGLMSTAPGLILVNLGYYVPFGVLLFMGFVKSVPWSWRRPPGSTARAPSAPSGRWSSRCCARPRPVS